MGRKEARVLKGLMELKEFREIRDLLPQPLIMS
jgi:hypothetical protein